MNSPRSVVALLLAVGCADRFEVDEQADSTESTGLATAASTETAAAGGTTSTTTTDSSSDPYCGNGIVEDGEECDEGDPDGLCTGCARCQLRRTAYFDGEGALIDVEGDVLALLDTVFTIEAWMRIDDGDEKSYIGRVDEVEGQYVGYSVSLTSTRLASALWDGSTPNQIAEASFLPYTWYHVAWTYDGAGSRLFADGNLVSDEQLNASVPDARSALRIGNLRGRIDEVRISSVVRYPAAGFSPARRFESDADTLLLLHLDGEAIDESSFGHNVSATDVVWEPDDGYGREAFCEEIDE